MVCDPNWSASKLAPPGRNSSLRSLESSEAFVGPLSAYYFQTVNARHYFFGFGIIAGPVAKACRGSAILKVERAVSGGDGLASFS